MIKDMEYSFKKIYKQFKIDGEFAECERYGEGHINDTFKLVVENNSKKVNYIL